MSIKSEKEQFLEYVLSDVLADENGISSRAMFGGYGIYKDGVIFAIIADERLYFKVDDSNRGDYERYGSGPFVYSQGKHKSITMSLMGTARGYHGGQAGNSTVGAEIVSGQRKQQ